MRILHLVPNMNFGGLQQVVRDLALCQKQAGHDVQIGCWTNESNNPEGEAQLLNAGIPTTYFRRGPTGKRIAGKKHLFLKLRTHLREHRIEILHIHNPFYHYLYGALAARTLRHVKVIATLHAYVMFVPPFKKWNNVFRSAASLSDAVVACCPEVQDIIGGYFPSVRSKLSSVENGIDLARFLSVPRRAPLQDGIVFGSIGRMAPEKNQRLLLQAFRRVWQRHPNIRLRFLGGGPLEPELRALTHELQLNDAVEFCGFSNDVPAFLRTVDVVVLSSNAEAMPLTLFEALASGAPVVATSVSCVPRIIHELQGGWTSPPRDLDAFAAALEEAINCGDLRQKGESARTRVSSQYSAARMAQDYESTYFRLLGHPEAATRSSAKAAVSSSTS